MTLFHSLRLTRAVVSHCRTKTFIAQNVRTFSVSHSKTLFVRGNDTQLSPVINSDLYLQQPQRWLSSDINPEDFPSVDYNDLIALLDSGDVQLIDVREPDELIEYGKIPKSLNIPLSRLTKSLSMNESNFIEQFGKEMPMKWNINLIFHSMGPIRSKAAMKLAHKLGFLKARHYPGGWEEWSEKQGLPLKKE